MSLISTFRPYRKQSINLKLFVYDMIDYVFLRELKTKHCLD